MAEHQNEGEEDERNMLTFPIDIIGNILARLPIKLLTRLKIVCKEWLTLISTAYFTDLHLRHHSLSSQRRLIVFDQSDNLYSVDIDSTTAAVKLQLPIELPFNRPRIAASYDGIVCLANPLTSEEGYVVLLNPYTGQYRAVVVDAALSYEFHVGLGFDSGNNELKLVILLGDFETVGPNQLRFYWKTRVYSLESNSWSLIEEDGFSNFSLMSYTSPTLLGNHLLHWIFDSQLPEQFPDKIACFDVCDNKWIAVPPPPVFADSEHDVVNRPLLISLVVLDECLCLATKNRVRSDMFDVWMMMEYGVAGSWVRLLSVYDSVATHYATFKLVAWSEDERELLVDRLIYGIESVQLCWYDVTKGTARDAAFDGVPAYYRSPALFRHTLAKVSGALPIDAVKQPHQRSGAIHDCLHGQ